VLYLKKQVKFSDEQNSKNYFFEFAAGPAIV